MVFMFVYRQFVQINLHKAGNTRDVQAFLVLLIVFSNGHVNVQCIENLLSFISGILIYLVKTFSISSKDLPLVSVTNFLISRK